MTYPPQQNTPPQRSSNRKAIIAIAACVAVVFAAANVWLIIKLTSDPDKTSDETSQSSDDSAQSSDSTEETDGAPESPLEVAYEIPEGFEESPGSELGRPLYENRTEHHMIMSDVDTYESIFVVSYVLPQDTSDYSEDQFIEEAIGFGEAVSRENSEQTEVVSGSGPVIVGDYLEAPVSSSTVKYDTFYYFDGYYLVQVGCQFDAEKKAVEAACGEFAETLSW